MNKIYTRINWENYPSEATALNETNLNKMDFALDEVDNRLIEQDTTKLSKTDASNDVVNWTMDEDTGVITVTRRNGEKIIFDLNIEKIPVSFSLSDDGILTMVTDDGTTFTANIGAMIPILTFNDSAEISVTATGTGINKTYSFSIKNGSVTENKLQPNFLADIKVQSANASSSASSAASSASDADYDAKLAQSYAIGMSGIRAGEDTDNAKYYKEQAKDSSDSASNSASSALTSSQTATTNASEAATSATNARKSESNANTYATNAKNSATSASSSATTATKKASEASISASNASQSASSSDTYSTKSQSYAVGGTGSRTGEDTDNAKYYNEQAQKALSEMQKSQVTGVKGNNETKFRTGNVNLTSEDVGAVAVGGDVAENTVTYESSDVGPDGVPSLISLEKFTTGEKLSSLIKKTSIIANNFRYFLKMLGTNDISAIGDGTVTGAISTLNSKIVANNRIKLPSITIAGNSSNAIIYTIDNSYTQNGYVAVGILGVDTRTVGLFARTFEISKLNTVRLVLDNTNTSSIEQSPFVKILYIKG